MKRIVILMMLAGTCFAGEYAVTVPADTCVMIAPARNTSVPVAWEDGVAVAQGVLRSSAGKIYMAVTAGTTGSTAPAHFSGVASDGAVLWVRVEKGSRKYLSAVAEGDGNVWYRLSPGTTNGGVYAKTAGQQYFDESDDALYAYTDDDDGIKIHVRDR